MISELDAHTTYINMDNLKNIMLREQGVKWPSPYTT